MLCNGTALFVLSGDERPRGSVRGGAGKMQHIPGNRFEVVVAIVVDGGRATMSSCAQADSKNGEERSSCCSFIPPSRSSELEEEILGEED